jgi:hypothetical protein
MLLTREFRISLEVFRYISSISSTIKWNPVILCLIVSSIPFYVVITLKYYFTLHYFIVAVV